MQYVPLIFAAAAAYILFRSFKIIGQAEVMVIERLGRFHRVARSGLNILIPILERPKELDVRYLESDVGGVRKITSRATARIDLREQVLNFPSQPVITKDNVTIDIDAVVYYRIADPQKATYSVQNLPYAIETLTRTTLRNIVGEMELDATLTSRDIINKRMREVIEDASIGWGVDVTRVELQSIEPPRVAPSPPGEELGEPGDARQDLVAHHVPLDEFSIFLIVRHRVRPRAHQAHAPLQDIQQLGQLIQRIAAQYPAHRRDAGIIA